MTEYIEREAVRNAILGEHPDLHYPSWYANIIDSIPVADVAPVVHGRWKTDSDRPDTLICSICKCGFDMWKHDPHNFCPNCGAKMGGGVNECD